MIKRELKTSDVFKIVNILKKIKFSEIKKELNTDKINNVIATMTKEREEAEKNGTEVVGSMEQELGLEIVLNIVSVVMEHLNDIEQDLYKFVGGLCELSAKQVSELPPADFINTVYDIVNMDGFKDFIKAVGKFYK